jgi:hypothetical protein
VPPTAALAGVPAGVQANGLWIGRRQLFVRFAAEAETATMYTPDALGSELGRLVARSVYHSVSVSGRDPLGNAAFLRAAFERHAPPIPVMLDCDGQRPEAIGDVAKFFALIQVTLDGAAADSRVERAMATLKAASAASVPHALVLAPEETTTDGQVLRVVTQAHQASAGVSIVVHPVPESTDQDRRWLTFMEQAVALHGDLRLIPRLSRPTGMR